ncbi:uncharacterized protein JN550_002850 [Neoarthrinium moseri]|uniref:uncharacterized protein n=1 Tax=Neoarthrinium moseri TaxID=1658444 RepID=UPI001FDC4815|nr:uncharacterized protein JN550_002850 [Neoarthrinium moseri]KAI1874271.1 hypothetical protein JN550_002850 [Neoarthrinium moseri]
MAENNVSLGLGDLKQVELEKEGQAASVRAAHHANRKLPGFEAHQPVGESSQYGYSVGYQTQLLLPSQLLSSNPPMQVPPSQLLSEGMPLVNPILSDAANNSQFNRSPPLDAAEYVKKANELINASLERTPGGTSVVEPDSVLDESGRLYHGYNQGKYFLPNDAAEQDRLDFQHKIFLIMLEDWLHLAPMTTVPNFVLDIATGTGTEKYPSSFVIGTDLSAIQPDPRVPNCVFQKDDADAPWVFPAPHPPEAQCVVPCEHRIMFDYIHLRLVATCFDDPRVLMRQAYDNLAPGGWIEYQDVSLDLQSKDFEGSAFQKYSEGCVRGAAVMGRDLLIPYKYKAYLEEVGFVDVEHRQLVLPYSPWPQDRKLRQAGLYNLQNGLDGARGFGYKMLRFAEYSPDEVETIVQEAVDYIKDSRNQAWAPLHIVYGRKPLARA